MTRKEYKRLGVHWSVLCQCQRSFNVNAHSHNLLDFIGRERRHWGISQMYYRLWDWYLQADQRIKQQNGY